MSARGGKDPLFLMNPIRNEHNRRKARVDEHNSRRRERRSNGYLKNRDIMTPSTSGSTRRAENVPPNANATVKKKSDSILRDWRNRKLKTSEQKSYQKPPFKVGTVKHKMDSPKFLHSSAPPVKLKRKLHRGKTKLKTESAPTSNKTADGRNAVKKTAEASVLEDAKETAETEINHALIFSPFIVTSRGKENVRIEQQSRLGIKSTRSDEIPTKDTVMKMLNISIEEEEMTAQYFRHILDREVKRLQNLCEVWLEQKSSDSTPEEVKLLINQAVGQTNLLMAKKFERFRGLVSDCEQGKGQMLVNCRDLQGFWDMMHLDIDNCNARFKMLDDLKDNGWQNNDVELPTNKLQVKKEIQKGRKKVVPKKVSSLRETIRNLRKKKQDLEKNEEFRTAASLEVTNEAMLLAQPKTVNSPAKNVLRGRDVNRQSLSRAVRMSEGKTTEVQTVALCAMRVSNLFKPLQVEMDESITYVNSTLTPGKSILKQADSESTLKSTKYQHFDSNEEIEDVRKTLDFCNESDDENDETLKNCTQNSKSLESKNNSATNDTLVESSLSNSIEPHRRSSKSIQHDSPVVELVKRMSPRLKHENCVKDIDELSSITPMKKKERQSSRKSMKFKEEYCFACTPSKPRTPGIRFSLQELKKNDSLEDKSKSSSKKKQVVRTPFKTSAGTRRSLRLAQKMQTPNDSKH